MVAVFEHAFAGQPGIQAVGITVIHGQRIVGEHLPVVEVFRLIDFAQGAQRHGRGFPVNHYDLLAFVVNTLHLRDHVRAVGHFDLEIAVRLDAFDKRQIDLEFVRVIGLDRHLVIPDPLDRARDPVAVLQVQDVRACGGRNQEQCGEQCKGMARQYFHDGTPIVRIEQRPGLALRCNYRKSTRLE